MLTMKDRFIGKANIQLSGFMNKNIGITRDHMPLALPIFAAMSYGLSIGMKEIEIDDLKITLSTPPTLTSRKNKVAYTDASMTFNYVNIMNEVGKRVGKLDPEYLEWCKLFEDACEAGANVEDGLNTSFQSFVADSLNKHKEFKPDGVLNNNAWYWNGETMSIDAEIVGTETRISFKSLSSEGIENLSPEKAIKDLEKAKGIDKFFKVKCAEFEAQTTEDERIKVVIAQSKVLSKAKELYTNKYKENVDTLFEVNSLSSVI